MSQDGEGLFMRENILLLLLGLLRLLVLLQRDGSTYAHASRTKRNGDPARGVSGRSTTVGFFVLGGLSGVEQVDGWT